MFIAALKSFIEAVDNNPEKLGKTLMDAMTELMPMMKCNPDGSSVYPVYLYENNPAERSFASIKKSEEVNMQAYYTFAEYLTSKGYADENNIYMFEYDGRMDMTPFIITAGHNAHHKILLIS